MVNVIKALLLGCVLLMILLPSSAMSPLIYTLIFAVSMVLVYFYWRLMYWVSEESAAKVIGEDNHPKFSLFVGKVPAITTEDLQRGRLIITADQILLYQRTKEDPCKLVWSMGVSEAKSVSFGKVIGARKGFTIEKNDEDSVSFTSIAITKRKAELFSALGWPYDNK